MFRSLLQVNLLLPACFVAVATVLAVREDKVANLFIAAACVACTVAGVTIALRRLVEDAYDSGKRAERRAILKEVEKLTADRIAAAKLD